jgi:hypothetical protein
MSSFVAVACSPAPSAGEAKSSRPELTACEDPRSQICTLQYDPVCGFASDGNSKTYGNACSACADETVSGHRAGACK